MDIGFFNFFFTLITLRTQSGETARPPMFHVNTFYLGRQLAEVQQTWCYLI